MSNTQEEQLIRELVNLPHYIVLKKIIGERLDRIKDVTTVDRNSPTYEAQCMGKSFAYEEVKGMLDELGLSVDKEPVSRRTYE
jgi:hypothetical protein